MRIRSFVIVVALAGVLPAGGVASGEGCGATPPGARDPLVASPALEHVPAEGRYAFTSRTAEGPRVVDKIIGALRAETTLLGSAGFSYRLEDPRAGLAYGLQVVPVQFAPDAGLFLRSLEAGHGAARIVYVPAVPLKLADFPIEPARTIVAVAPDAEARTVVAGPISRPDPHVMRSSLLVGLPEFVELCGELAIASRAVWDLRIDGTRAQRIFGHLWLAPQYGGWPIKEDLIASGVVDGSFASTLRYLDPVSQE